MYITSKELQHWFGTIRFIVQLLQLCWARIAYLWSQCQVYSDIIVNVRNKLKFELVYIPEDHI